MLRRLPERIDVRHPIPTDVLPIDPDHSLAHGGHVQSYWIVTMRSIEVPLKANKIFKK